MIRFLRGLINNKLIQSVSVLAGGTAFAQLITILIMPILTRMYSPDQFGVLAVYSACLAIITGVACLRLDIVIPIPKSDDDAINILAISVCIAAVTSLLVLFILACCPFSFIGNVGGGLLVDYIWLIPVGIFLGGIYSALQYWSIREKKFLIIAKSKVSQAGLSSTTQLLMGYFGSTGLGLLIGQMLQNGGGSIYLLTRLWRDLKSYIGKITIQSMFRVFKEFRRYPQISTFESLANSAAIQLPIIIISGMILGREIGFLMLSLKVMQVPVALIGGSLGQVFLSAAPDAYRDNKLQLIALNTIRGLIRIGVGPLIMIGVLAPYLFEYVFGQDWRDAGVYVTWMLPWILFQYLSSPLSMVLHVVGRQHYAFVLQVFGLLVRVGFVLGFSIINSSLVIKAYIISGFVFYIVYFLVIVRVIGVEIKDLVSVLYDSVSFVLPWVLIALAVLLSVDGAFAGWFN